MSPSKREKEYARRRYAKRAARQEKAARVARERRIVGAVVVVVLAAVVVLLIVLNSRTETDPEAPPSTSETAATATAEGTETEPEALPTTDPQRYDAPPPASDSLDTSWDAVISTSAGDIAVTLDGAAAPQAVASFLMLAGDGFFDGTACHRLLPDSLLQCGDPTAAGNGGPGYSFGPIENAPEDDVYPAGSLAMARQPQNGESMGSQFFLVFADVPLPSDSAGGYTVFGQVTEGLDILEQIGAAGTVDGGSDGRPAENVIIESVDIQ
ncbi:peptidylprolyl isomerase [Ruania alba]|uniref:Peptidyl-prolyl cis-trans isomerase n=1 Tax=Ruania alba TaxID=648782 RepID=A0A1H5FQE6_9MICO|nr:peptidylprolyl isomerase [Ruania alba]SEE05690.1 peptidyl-prolyl cis-trans isomerase B (cyclophilin B) [Ruania alba]